MPAEISPMLCLIWFCVGFFTGLGWALGCWVIGRLTR
jgi:hypothetical protein